MTSEVRAQAAMFSFVTRDRNVKMALSRTTDKIFAKLKK